MARLRPPPPSRHLTNRGDIVIDPFLGSGSTLIAAESTGRVCRGEVADGSADELLPAPYFHIVFTLPAPVAAIAFQNKAAVYAILFKAAVEAMTTLAINPRRLGARIGGLAVLHTWGRSNARARESSPVG